MKTLVYVLGGVVVVGGAIFGVSKLTSTPSTAENAPIVDQSTSNTASAGDFGECDLKGYSSVKVVGKGLGLSDTTLTIKDGKAFQFIKSNTSAPDLTIDRTTSVCSSLATEFKSLMQYDALGPTYNPKGINTKGTWFSREETNNSSQNLKEIVENGKAVLVYESRVAISSKPGYISITQKKVDKARGIYVSYIGIIYKSSDLMLSTPIESISKNDAVDYASSVYSYQ